MRKIIIVFVFILIFANLIVSQNKIIHPTKVSTAIYHDVFGPIRDLPALSPQELEARKNNPKKKRNEELKERLYPFSSNALPKGADPIWQKKMGSTNVLKSVLQNFNGQSSYSDPPDCNGAVGPNHYMQTINVTYTIYNKTGTLLAGPTDMNTLFSGVTGATVNDGDPIIMYDEQAGKWLAAEFSGVNTDPDYMLIAVSTTNDPTGTWNRWSFLMNGFPDYMKFGIWRDGYYMGTNTSSGDDIYVFERDVMIAGGASPQMVQFDNSTRPNSGFHCVLPLDNDGAFAPINTPGQFITINDDAWGGSDELRLYELDVDWTTPANSTFSQVQSLAVPSFDSNFGSNWENISQPGTTQKLDAIPQILMFRAQYRNFGTSQSIVCMHTVDVDNSDHAGIRWYELQNTGTTWSIRQNGTYAPDGDSRWMGSIAMNGNHEIAIAYSVSSSSIYPSIRYCGQSTTANSAANNTLDIAEGSIQVGSVSQTSSERWGDYSNISVDPNDDETFWFSTEYNNTSDQRYTKIASFDFAPEALVADFSASPASVSVGGTVTYTDASTGPPTSWSWSFTGGTPSTATGAGPHDIAYNTAGNYDASLQVGDGSTTDTELKSNYITVTSCTYCTSNGTTSFDTGTTLVDFNTINNSTAKPAGYNDYTAQSTTVTQGNSYNLTVNVNTDGSYTVNTLAWIDWNQDCDFDDPGEEYDLGDAYNVASGATSLSPLSITVPATATTGNTRMRVSTKYNSDPTSCETGFDGEVEDYTVNVASASCSYPTTQTSSFSSSNILSSSMDITWTRGNGDRVIVLARSGGAVTSDPSDGSSYTANSIFGSGDEIGTGNYVVYDGTGTTVNVSGLSSSTTYHFAFYEYSTTGDCYLTPALTGNETTSSACTYCAASGTSGNEYISGVTIGSIVNTGTGDNAYTDYTAQSTDLHQGQSAVSVKIDATNGLSSDDIGIWVDWNQDCDFDDAGENIACQDGTPYVSTSFLFDVPATAALGQTVMRVRLKRDAAGCGSSCGTTTYGEVEDYTINVTASCSPVTQASAFSSSAILDNSMTVSWIRGSGDRVIVIARGYSSVDTNPSGGTSYAANSVFGSGDEIGTQNYVVYDGTGTSVNITGLSSGTTYYYAVCEYNVSDSCYLIPALTGDATTTGSCTYCSSTGNMDDNTSTTLVNFNTLNNSTGKTAGYNDYTAQSTDIIIGNSYDFTVNVNTDGNYTVHTKVWIDWNQNCNFYDAGEEYDLGDTSNVIHDPTNLSPLSITVPGTAILGTTRMRVTTKYGSDPTACETLTYGEVEDYSVNIVASCTYPTTQASVFSSSNILDNSMDISWTRGNGDRIIVLARSGGAVTSDPSDGSSYTANSTFGSGDEIGTGNYVVYDGTGTTVNISGLSSGTTYHFALYEYNTTADCYLTPALTGNEATTSSSCTYCAASGTPGDEHITSIEMGSISNTGTGDDGYADYTSQSTDLHQGETGVTITGTFTPAYSGDDVGVWIDWNQDCDFDDADENVVCLIGVSSGDVASFDVPATATLGTTRMRIRLKYSGTDCGSSCGTTSFGEVEDYSVNILPCIPCAASGTAGDEHITGVEMGSISNTGTGDDGYADYTNLSTDLEQGQTGVTITGTFTPTYSGDDVGVWIDWNHDCDFDDADENVVCIVGVTSGQTATFDVPVTATLGITTMRIRLKYNGTDCGSSCGTTSYGEVEDYSVNVTPQSIHWTGTTSTDWATSSNWSPATVPTSSDKIIIPTGLTNYPIVDETANCNNANVNDGGKLTISTGGDLSINGNLTVGEGASGEFEMNDGNCSVSGNYYTEIGATTDINGGTWSFANWYRNQSTVWSKGIIQLSGGTITASDAVIWSAYDVSGTMDGSFTLNIGDVFRLDGSVFTSITGGTVVLNGSTSSDTTGIVASDYSSGKKASVYNLTINGSGKNFAFSFDDATCRSDLEVVNDLYLQDGNIMTAYGSGYPEHITVGGNISVGANADVTSNSNTAITGSGNITLLNDGTNKASWIDDSNLSISGSSNVYSYFTDNRWHFVSSPVSSAVTNVFYQIYLTNWDETDSTWTYIEAINYPLLVGRGYAVWSELGNPTIDYTGGSLNSGNTSPSLTATDRNSSSSIGLNEGWNLLGNPYPSAIDWGTVNDPVSGYVRTNIDNSIYIWTGSQYASFNPAGNGGDGLGTNGGTRYIASSQAFFIKANDYNPALTIPNSSRLHNASANLKSEEQIEILRFMFSGNEYSDEIVICTDPEAQESFDNVFDSYKLFGIEEAPQIYSLNGNAELSINTYPSFYKNLSIPVGIRVGKSGTYSIRATQFVINNPDLFLYIEDLMTRQYTLIEKDKDYEFFANSGMTIDRFVLHFKDKDFDPQAASEDGVWVFASYDGIHVNSSDALYGDIIIYNMLGQEVVRHKADGNNYYIISVNSVSGYYFVQVISDSEFAGQKVFVR